MFDRIKMLVEQAQHGIIFNLSDYLELLDFTARTIRRRKPVADSGLLPPILQRLSLNQHDWLKRATQFEARYTTFFSPRVHRDTA